MSQPRRVNRNRHGEILAYMSKHPGIHHSIDDIMDGLRWDESQRTAVAVALRVLRDESKIEQHARGSYIYRQIKPEVKPETYSNLYEFLGKLSDGSVIMRNENGELERFTKQ